MINITVNGKPHSLDVSPEMPVLWVLRDVLELTGTKYSCGLGVCGTCSILVEGKALRSCVTPISILNNKEIVSIEGISEINKSVQKAWEKLNVPQCGFCQPGQVISAVALLNEKPSPSDEDIDKGMSGNICRCGTYVRIRKAIHLAASMRNESENEGGL
ncbi:(2Fe-2S)-binding protein [Lutimonas saemankumensis]|uniref:(2Fe-2S)-binding protein n=1 Tax=Lutimonas saemankumensis TaxID=483016 RepID=UPI001CD301B3|nr:(2Fe-2S)-binding protein [Lutimonas saemankumensis]MCA0931922.1 (2Fe-2S)-binding protein [Lutimonas saemankumensis]